MHECAPLESVSICASNTWLGSRNKLHEQKTSARSKGSLCTDGGEACEREASAQPRHCPEPSTPRQEMEVDPNEEVIRLKAQVAELQLERQVVQEADSSRKKARTVELSLTYVTPVHGGSGGENPSLVMSSLIEAADSALREAGRGAP